MKTLKKTALIGLIAALPLQAGAGDDGKSTAEKPKPAVTAATAAKPAPVVKPSYKPPLRGAPAGRVGGGTRGDTERESFSLLVLAPDHVGYTTREQPCLYWFISKTTSYPVEVTITERKAVKPLVQKLEKGPEKAGIQSVCLTDLGVKLQKKIPYKWFITLVTDAEQRSKDILAGGIVELTDPPATLQPRLVAADSGAQPGIYADEGLWYDALESLSRLIARFPNSNDLKAQRASLLEQVGLRDAADFAETP